NKKKHHMFHLLLTILCNTPQPAPEVVPVYLDIFISDKGRREFELKMDNLENAVDIVKSKVESDLRKRAEKEPTNKNPMFQFNIVIQPELPIGIDLDTCGYSIEQLSNQLQQVHTIDPGKNVLLFYNCDSEIYNDDFANAKLESPLIVQSNNTLCVKTMTTFVNAERTKFELTLANALLHACGANSKNPVSLSEEPEGDMGVSINFFYKDKAFDLMHAERCEL
ncbi:MAG: hypothetical protein ACRCZW_03585, partial [Lactobacillaceae bacterium]